MNTQAHDNTPHSLPQTTAPLWLTEFGAGFEVPPAIANDIRLEDVSWHNDVCPSFAWTGRAHDGDDVRIWIDHPDRMTRQFPEHPRFVVQRDSGSGPSIQTDDLDRAVRAFWSLVTWEHTQRAAELLESLALDEHAGLLRQLKAVAEAAEADVR